jgi:hypothetical protein
MENKKGRRERKKGRRKAGKQGSRKEGKKGYIDLSPKSKMTRRKGKGGIHRHFSPRQGGLACSFKARWTGLFFSVSLLTSVLASFGITALLFSSLPFQNAHNERDSFPAQHPINAQNLYRIKASGDAPESSSAIPGAAVTSVTFKAKVQRLPPT